MERPHGSTLRLCAGVSLLGAVLAGPVGGQERGAGNGDERVRLDDFALPDTNARAAAAIDQLSKPGGALPVGETTRPQQQAALPIPAATGNAAMHAPPLQLGETEARRARREPLQVEPSSKGRKQSVPAIASRADSKPAAAEAIAGKDDCDPGQGAARRSERCRHVLERRAEEFDAPEVPVLTAEEELLIAQERALPGLAAAAQDPRLPGGAPRDADNRTAQELAAVVLGPQVPDQAQLEDGSVNPAEPGVSLGQELIDALAGGGLSIGAVAGGT